LLPFIGGGDGPSSPLACGAGPSSQLVGAGGGPSSKMVGGGGWCLPFVGWGAPCGCWCWAVLAVGRGRWWVVFTVGMGSWWAVFAVGRGSWWAMFIVRRGLVGADSGPLSSFVGAGLWGGAGSGPLSSLLVGWCWAVAVICGVVLGHWQHSWGGAGPGSSSPMLGVVMGHCLGGWWWALVAVRVDTLPLCSIVVVVLCCIEIGRRTMIVRCPVAMLLMWHLAPGLANSKGRGD